MFTPCSTENIFWGVSGVWPTRKGGITCGPLRSLPRRILALTPSSWPLSQRLTMNCDLPSLTLRLVSSNPGVCPQYKQQMLPDPRCCWMPSARPSLFVLGPSSNKNIVQSLICHFHLTTSQAKARFNSIATTSPQTGPSGSKDQSAEPKREDRRNGPKDLPRASDSQACWMVAIGSTG